MFKRMLTLWLFATVALQAQSQSLARKVTLAKMEIMKASLEFIITDSAEKAIKEKICKTCDDYASLKKFASFNNIQGGGKIIDQWKSWKIDTLTQSKAQSDLSKFALKVDSSITNGKHAERKRLYGYDNYVKTINKVAIISASRTEPDSDTVNQPNDADLPNDLEPRVEDSWMSALNISYATCGVLAILLISVVFKNAQLRKKYGRNQDELKRLTSEKDHLKFNYDQLQKELKEVQASWEDRQLRAETAPPDASIEETEQKTDSEANDEASLTVVWDKPEASVKVQEIFYSRYADLVDGFSASELLAEEGNDTIFEITIFSPNKASFRVSTNPAAQKYALSNADYFLEPTCRYDSVPAGTIINEKPGLLQLVGGKWEIKEQANISFK